MEDQCTVSLWAEQTFGPASRGNTMADIRDDFDKIVGAMGRASLLVQLHDKIVEVRQTDRRECGNCYYWMMSRYCPREQNVDGYQVGPSMNTPACDKFNIKQDAIDLKMKRLGEAIAFAKKHNLPIPGGHQN